MSENVSVPRWLLSSGAAALGASLLALAFLAGRASVGPAPPVSGGASSVEQAPPPDDEHSNKAISTIPDARTSSRSAGAASDETASGSDDASGGAPPSAPSNNAAVIDYLDALDAALATRNAGAEPETLARAVVADALAGRTGSIETLLETTEAAQARARGLSPPPAARTLHRDTMGLLSETVRVYKTLRDGIAAGDLARLSGLQSDATRLQRAAAAVDEESRRLRAVHGG